MLIEEYFEKLFSAIDAHPLVNERDIAAERRSDYIGHVRGVLVLRDGSRLFVREFLETRSQISRFSYAYHLVDADGVFILRYDNAPHHAALSTFPHHVHEGADVLPSNEMDLASVLVEIDRRTGV
jgi:hypothetical protein